MLYLPRGMTSLDVILSQSRPYGRSKNKTLRALRPYCLHCFACVVVKFVQVRGAGVSVHFSVSLKSANGIDELRYLHKRVLIATNTQNKLTLKEEDG